MHYLMQSGQSLLRLPTLSLLQWTKDVYYCLLYKFSNTLARYRNVTTWHRSQGSFGPNLLVPV